MRPLGTARVLIVLALVGPSLCCKAQEVKTPKPAQVGFPWDWTHQHVVFTNTTNPEVAKKVRQDPRLFHHWLMRNLPLFERNLGGPDTPRSDAIFLRDDPRDRRGPRHRRLPFLKTDWNVNLGNGGFVIANTFPAKWTLDVNAAPSCTQDYVVFPTGANGSTLLFPQASIVGFNQLYSTQSTTGGFCNQNGPSVAFSYINNAACSILSSTSNDSIDSSPVLSFDGKKIAWVTTTGKVQVLTIGTTGNNGTSPTAPVCVGSFPFAGTTNNAALASVTLNGGPTVTNSAVFVDYVSDTGYVGDDSGKVHKFAPFFNGSLTEVTTGGWPVTVSSAATKILTGPVFDSVSNNIFVGDNESTAGKLFYVRIAAGSLGTCSAGSPPCLGSASVTVSTKMGLSDSPVVDSSNGWVYVQTSNADGTNAKILQANTTLTSTVTANVGGDSGVDLHSGAYDNAYFNSGPTNASARYYVCGLDNAGSNSVVYQFGFSGTTGQLNSSPTASIAVTSASNSPCSPLTESYNPNATGGAKDWLFLSVANNGVGGCGNSPCVYQINVTNAPPTLSIGQTATYSPNSGTSGMIVDNVSVLSETSNVYFVPLGARACSAGGTGACATKLHQSNLQ